MLKSRNAKHRVHNVGKRIYESVFFIRGRLGRGGFGSSAGDGLIG